MVYSVASSPCWSASQNPIASPSKPTINCCGSSSSSSNFNLIDNRGGGGGSGRDSDSSSACLTFSEDSMFTSSYVLCVGGGEGSVEGGGGGGVIAGVCNGDYNYQEEEEEKDEEQQLQRRLRSSRIAPSSQEIPIIPRACTPERSLSPRLEASMLKSPPTPHKIQSLDEKSLGLDENCLNISSPRATKNAHINHITASNIAKPLNSAHQNKTVKFVDGEKKKGEKPPLEICPVRRRLNGTKLTDYFVQRRSNRKTQGAINAEKHQFLVKAIQDGQQDGLTVKRFNGKGRGVVATKRFLRHEFVVEYAGDLLTSGKARARENKYAKDSGAGCYMYYFQYNNQQYCVDATKESERLGRLINHSRNGNLVTKVVEVKNTPRLILIAKRDIDVDEELNYDYGDRSREALRHHPWLAC